ncbi:MAG: DUF3520 domain-containing protein, partial [Acidobacteria bacterium]|nr:DUF3520 domain-containing protein [Acidobacteriota bacterium]
DDFCFAAAVAAFGMLLRDSEFAGDMTFDDVRALAENGLGRDRHGYRTEFLELIGTASGVKRAAQRHAAN